MELKRRISLDKLFKSIATIIVAIYLVIGFLPAEASSYSFDSELAIPSIGLNTPVTKLSLGDSGLNTPDTIVGSYTQHDSTTLLIGHSTTVFKNLIYIKNGDLISYGQDAYRVTSIKLQAKQNIKMNELLKSSKKQTLVLMTCAGRKTAEGFTHRLIVKAEKL